MQLSRPCLFPAFTVTVCLLARAARGRLPSSTASAAAAAVPGSMRPGSLAAFHPAIAHSWLTAAANKLLQPQHVLPTSRKLAWWRCPHCSYEHNRRIDLHVAAGGACPKCSRMPTLLRDRGEQAAGGGAALHVKHRCRPDNALAVLAAPNANRVKSSIADDGYLRVVEKRNLQPMLARTYTKEARRIGENDALFVSPKLDGVRCVVAWNAREQQLCFFSRSGTLFECCDHHIEPMLQPLFVKDPLLVLDGELYNHGVDDFEQLVSAIRTSRERRTPAVARQQEQLQFHVFDIMYAGTLPDMSTVPFSQRYSHLRKLIATLTPPRGQRHSSKAVQLVPAKPVRKTEIERELQLALADGYEGIIVRCDGTVSEADNSRGKRNKSSGSSGGRGGSATVGYAYGARSPNLLKYKLMQDDEYVIVSGIEGRGKWKGCLGAFVCSTKGGHLFTVAPATTEETKKNMWRRLTQYKGKLLTVQYQELSASGVPRFPIGKCVRGSKGGKDWI